MIRRSLAVAVFSALLTVPAAPVLAQGSSVIQLYQELFAASQKDKRGLTFHVNGQSIGGVTTKVVGTEAVEVRNQTHGRIIILIDQIDALAAN